MSKTIRIDDDLWEILKQHAQPLEDTPSDVLRRIFKKAGLLKFDELELLDLPVTHLELSDHAREVLRWSHTTTIGNLVQQTEYDFKRMRRCGKKTINELKRKLAERGLSLGMDLNALRKQEEAE
jgi:DNA-directed RNA polymerase alpha subunit